MSAMPELKEEYAPLSTEPGEIHLHLWTVKDYYKMFEAELFEGKPVELIEGQVVEISAMATEHATAVVLAGEALSRAFGPGYHVRTQMSFKVGERSEPQLDLAVVKGKARDYKNAHPTNASLIVEVADSSLQFDRTVKASLYAAAEVKDYWIINLAARRLEVYRKPVKRRARQVGFGYSEIKMLTEADTMKPLAGRKEIAVADLLP